MTRLLLVCRGCYAQPDTGPECPHCTMWLTALEIGPDSRVTASRIAKASDVRTHRRVSPWHDSFPKKTR